MPSEPVRRVAPPPGLHWSIVLILSIVTAGLFLDIWILVQAVWVRKLDRSSKALAIYIVGIVLGLFAEARGTLDFSVQVAVAALVGALACVLIASFGVRDALSAYIAAVERRPAPLSGLLTIFLGPVYLQYHMNKVRAFERQTLAAGVR